MATDAWVGTNGTLSGDWSDVNDWSLVAEPGTADVAEFDGAGPYIVTVDTLSATAARVTLASGVTLAIGTTLGVSGAVVAAAGADVDLSGQFAAGLLDLTGGGTLTADGGTLDGALLFGPTGTINGAGTVTNLGSIGWSSTSIGAIVIASAGFDNAGQFVLAASMETINTSYPVVTHVGLHTITTDLPVTFVQAFGANVSLTGASFVNGTNDLISLQGGTLNVSGGSFDNAGNIMLGAVSTQNIQPEGTTYEIVTSLIPGQLDVQASVTSFVNTGTITATNIVFAQPTFDNAGAIIAGSITFDQTTLTNTGSIQAGNVAFTQDVTLSQVGAISGNLTFDNGVDLDGGTLAANSVTVGGLVENGTIGGTGTLTMLAGTTLDNVAIGSGVTVVEPASGRVSVIDPPPSAAVTLDAAITSVTFNNASTFDGSIVLGHDASTNDVVRLLNAGGLTLGPDFTLTSAGDANGVTFANPAATLSNEGSWTVNGVTVDVKSTLAGTGTVSLDSQAQFSVAALAGGGTFNLNNGAVMSVATLAAGATPSVAFGTGASQLVLPGTGAISAVLSGLTMGDVVDFASVSPTPDPTFFGTAGAVATNGSLFLTGASGDGASVALSGSTGSLNFTLAPDSGNGTEVIVACFAAGTRIATEHGEVPVEALRPGDRVRTASDRVAPVVWIGRTRVDLSRHPAPHRVAPLRIRAGAFGAGLPGRDLLVSPDHALWLRGVLIPAGRLEDGVVVTRAATTGFVTYWHVELDRHDVLLAEGLPAESFLDTGNRALFAGEPGARPLHADFSPPEGAASQAVWEAMGCAKLCLDGPEVRAARAALWRRRAIPPASAPPARAARRRPA
jgi:hypothetical protein